LDAADLRVLISQHFGLPYLVPLALERLAKSPFLDAQYSPGDLLEAVLRVPASFWHAAPALRDEVEKVLRSAGPLPKGVDEALKKFRSR
jgi:hypothetical protein